MWHKVDKSDFGISCAVLQLISESIFPRKAHKFAIGTTVMLNEHKEAKIEAQIEGFMSVRAS